MRRLLLLLLLAPLAITPARAQASGPVSEDALINAIDDACPDAEVS